MTRAVTTVRIINNKSSVPPLALNLSQASPIYRTALSAGQLALVGSGGAGGYTYSVTGLPAGLSLNTATGAITGTPTTLGHYIVSATVTDSATNTFTTTFSVDVLSRISIAGAFQPVAEVGVAISNTLAVSGATGTVSWSISASPYPGGGVSFSTSTATLSGTPTTTGNWTGTVTASDSGTGDSAVYTFVHTIVSALHAASSGPNGSGSPLPRAATNIDVIVATLTRSNGYGAVTWSASASPAPDGLTFAFYPVPYNSNQVRLSVRSSNAGSAAITATCKDAFGATATASADVDFFDPNELLTTQESGVDVGNAGIKKINFVGATVTDAGGGVRNVSGLQGPQGATGPTGPQGATGAQGATGPQGATGSGGGGSNTIYFA